MREGASSVRLRATLAATLVVALALGVTALVLAQSMRGTLVASADADAARRAVGAVPALQASAAQLDAQKDESGAQLDTWQAGPVMPLYTQRADSVTRLDAPTADLASQLDAQKGEKVSVADRTQPFQTVVDPDVMLSADGKSFSTAWEQVDGFRVVGMAVTTEAGPGMVLARSSLAPTEQALNTLNSVLLPGVPALLLVVAVMTWLSVGRALRPVAAIRAKVADITARDLHQRVPVPSSGDEIAALATTVNGTLDRLETAVDRHKSFVADAAHELRSPIATLRARLELAEPSELTAEALADVERLQSLAGDLLLLARLDAGEPLQAADVDLGQIAAEEAVRVERRPEVELKLDVQPDVVIEGVRGHVGRLVTNLASNAVRHAASTVVVRVRSEGTTAVLEVDDDGPGIPEGQREAVFGRFTRLDEARARDAGGAGLGLPIARDIATLHGGTVHAVSGGFVARFPMNHYADAVRVDG
ncbi:sensor histidine kinase [Nonomuraea endophytica]|uniref:histidine kinase n=1 Tax=Nonomuraea endophytica TaxID=714136 RepID=A0A7W7ZZ03_9ACTN|nr:ATP-binding protein [Nonomuraea endophytica]MBB5075905.1 signal transduction histidine kinase [Nonomuraea endophytica]